MQLQDFSSIKRTGGVKHCFWFGLSKKVPVIWESSHWELFCKKGVLRCVFDQEFEVFWRVQSWGGLTKVGPLLKICLLSQDIDVFWMIIGGLTQNTLANQVYILVKIYIFCRDSTAIFLSGICSLLEKRHFPFLSLTNSYLQLPGTLRCFVR